MANTVAIPVASATTTLSSNHINYHLPKNVDKRGKYYVSDDIRTRDPHTGQQILFSRPARINTYIGDQVYLSPELDQIKPTQYSSYHDIVGGDIIYYRVKAEKNLENKDKKRAPRVNFLGYKTTPSPLQETTEEHDHPPEHYHIEPTYVDFTKRHFVPAFTDRYEHDSLDFAEDPMGNRTIIKDYHVKDKTRELEEEGTNDMIQELDNREWLMSLQMLHSRYPNDYYMAYRS